MKASLIRSIIFISTSFLNIILINPFYCYSQTINKILYKTDMQEPNLRTSLFYYKNKPFAYKYEVKEGFVIYDLIHPSKKILVRDQRGINPDKSNDLIFYYLGEINDKVYFLTQYNILNPVVFEEDLEGEVWSFDGKNVNNIPYPKNVYNFLAHGALSVSSGSRIISTNRCILMKSGASYGDNLSTVPLSSGPSFAQFDGERFTLVNFSDQEPTLNFDFGELKFDNSIILSGLDSEGNGKIFSYDGKSLMKIWPDKQEMTYRVSSLHKACENLFVFETYLKSNCSGDCHYTNLRTIGGPVVFEVNESNVNILNNTIIPFGNKLIFGIREYKSSSKDGFYVTDGTKSGTRFLSRKPFLEPDLEKPGIYRLNHDSYVTSYAYNKKELYFVMRSSANGKRQSICRIWVTDGSDAGTSIVKEFKGEEVTGLQYSKGSLIYSKDGKLCFLSNNVERIISNQRKRKERSFNVYPDGKIYFIDDINNGSLLSFDVNAKVLPDKIEQCILKHVPASSTLDIKPIGEKNIIDFCGKYQLQDDYPCPCPPNHDYALATVICSQKDNPYCTVKNVFSFMVSNIEYMAPASVRAITYPTRIWDFGDARTNSLSAQPVTPKIYYITPSPNSTALNDPDDAEQINRPEKFRAKQEVLERRNQGNKVCDCKETMLIGWDIEKLKKWSGVFNVLNPFDGFTIKRDNPIFNKVYPQQHTAVNYTVAGHVLYPGKVTRQVVEENGQVIIKTRGVGSTPLHKINIKVGRTFFARIDNNLWLDFNTVANSLELQKLIRDQPCQANSSTSQPTTKK